MSCPFFFQKIFSVFLILGVDFYLQVFAMNTSSETKKWYDGYCVDGISIYNPKSVVEAMLRGKFNNYWTKTETYEALKVYIDLNQDGLRTRLYR